VKVSHLIELRKQQDQGALVVLWDNFGSEPGISKLGHGEVNPTELCGHDNDGIFVVDIYNGQHCDGGPFSGVVLGRR